MKVMLSEPAFLKHFGVLLAFGSAPIWITTLTVVCFYGVDWKGIPWVLALLLSPVCWSFAQLFASNKGLSLERSMWLSAASVGVAFISQWAMAWEGSGHDGMAMGYALHFLTFFTAVMAFAYYLIWKYRRRLGISWAFRHLMGVPACRMTCTPAHPQAGKTA